MPGFQLHGIDDRDFAPLFTLDDAALAARGAERVIATASPGFPCRVSLADASIGDELLLLPFAHQPAPSPFRASGPIYVRRGACRRQLAAGEVPVYITRRPISARAYDVGHAMVAASVVPGEDAAAALGQLLDLDQVAYVHLHHAARGCYLARVDRT